MNFPRFAVLSSLLLATPLHAATEAVQRETVNRIVVQVYDSVITLQDLRERGRVAAEEIMIRYAGQGSVLANQLRSLEKQTMDELIEDKLILHEFKVSSYALPIDRIVNEQVEEDIKKKFGGNRLTLTKTLLAEGITLESYRKRIEETTIIDWMRQRNVAANPPISPAKVEKFYLDHLENYKLEDQVKLRTIVIKNRADGVSAQKLVDEIRRKIVSDGAAFDEMARIYSDGSQRSEGGDWGWITRGIIEKAISDKAFSLQPGLVSEPIPVPEGVYLMLVEEASPAHTRSFSEVRAEIEAALKTEKRQQLFKEWIDRLRDKAFIRYFPA